MTIRNNLGRYLNQVDEAGRILTPQLRQRIEMLQMTSIELNELVLLPPSPRIDP